MKKISSILIVDDDRSHRIMLKTLLTSWGYEVREAEDGDIAVRYVKEIPFDLVLMDVRMTHMSGLEALPLIKNHNPAVPVIIMTAYASVESAVEAMKNGAYDYLQKPLDFEELKIKIERAMEHRRLVEENAELKAKLGASFDRHHIIGNSPAMISLLDTVSQVAPSEATVLILGESGTGKELIASAIHYNSPRRQGPFIRINCGAITETLLESELFGHEKGAFTGADRRREGKFIQASGGSIFLDEITETSPAMQVKLLRVLQEREVTRVGGTESLPIDVRVLAATNRDIRQAVATGKFREDLYYRLNVVTLEVPPLRHRKEDIPLLAQHFLGELSAKNKKTIAGFTPQAMDMLIKHSWPGNVRELMNTIERAVVLAKGDYITPEDLALKATESKDLFNLKAFVPLEEVEKQTIVSTLTAVGGNKSEAARRLGITRRTLHLKLKKYGLM
ncbi:MAG: sigma-54 dependent transcriptional regulator [Syntrophales bacterium]|nr:sigma-54 dependent transcriptional regulator [Syntrophales bacterium]